MAGGIESPLGTLPVSVGHEGEGKGFDDVFSIGLRLISKASETLPSDHTYTEVLKGDDRLQELLHLLLPEIRDEWIEPPHVDSLDDLGAPAEMSLWRVVHRYSDFKKVLSTLYKFEHEHETVQVAVNSRANEEKLFYGVLFQHAKELESKLEPLHQKLSEKDRAGRFKCNPATYMYSSVTDSSSPGYEEFLEDLHFVNTVYKANHDAIEAFDSILSGNKHPIKRFVEIIESETSIFKRIGRAVSARVLFSTREN